MGALFGGGKDPPPPPPPPPAANPPTMANSTSSAAASAAKSRAALAEGSGFEGTLNTSGQGAPKADTTGGIKSLTGE